MECPPPQLTEGSGERRKLPSEVRGSKRVLVHFELDGDKFDRPTFDIFAIHIWSHNIIVGLL